jgi:NAD(P)-dependent dehydrogenase (short-subunit alcohol dehydrogenase family)
MSSRLWLITGVSRGFGRAFADAALARGDKVVGTVRDEAQRAAFDALAPGRSFGRKLDVRDTAALAPAIAGIEGSIGPIDVLVNNAGYGHEGVLEESPLDDLRQQFEVNVFGAVAVIQAVLPFMRKRRRGHIVNVTSMGGITTFPGLSYYHGSKFALEGISETLGKEVKELGIRVTALEPGAFRTDWAGTSMVRGERSIADYDAVFDPHRQRRKGYSGKQPGDPAKAAEALLQLVDADDPPAHLLLGTDALRFVREKLANLEREMAAWEKVSASTDFPPGE